MMKTKYLVLSDIYNDRRFSTFRKAKEAFNWRVKRGHIAQLWRDHGRVEHLIWTTTVNAQDQVVPKNVTKRNIKEYYNI